MAHPSSPAAIGLAEGLTKGTEGLGAVGLTTSLADYTNLGGTLVVLIKEIGTDCLFALHLVAKQMDKKLGTAYLPRVRAIYEHCRNNDLAMAVAQTDVKGDRSRGPAEPVTFSDIEIREKLPAGWDVPPTARRPAA